LAEPNPQHTTQIVQHVVTILVAEQIKSIRMQDRKGETIIRIGDSGIRKLLKPGIVVAQ